jgi:singapore isolate B (sub-type 7) whole genome shotgun sequence assembly, scaffold_5
LIDSDKPYILFVHPKNFKTNVPKKVVIRIAFSEMVVPNAGVISFTGEKNNIEVNIQSSKEVSCSNDECMIKPSKEFEPGMYSMSFGENAFKDLAGNTLVKGVSGHIFTVAEVSCGIDYVHVNKDQPCYCQSVGNQCQCQCGETYFVKDY